VALIGCGAWGKNILRVLEGSPRARVIAVADRGASSRALARALAPTATIVAALGEALALGVDAVVIATPAHTHAALALEAMDAGADVFVEKPLAMSIADAEQCAARAAALGRVGMVGHLLRYHPTVVQLLDMARRGALGDLLRVESARLSTSGDRSASVLWTLGPHDLSVLHALDPSPLRLTRASGPQTEDEAMVEIELASKLSARITLSRKSPTKERRLVVVGADRAAVFDDVRAPDRVLLGQVERRRAGTAEVTITSEVTVAWREPLAIELDHFLCCVEERATPLTPLSDGALVVGSLHAAELGTQRAEGVDVAMGQNSQLA